jgi:hypothetical protein
MNQMCRTNVLVSWVHCPHTERRTADPCGQAPDGRYGGGTWQVSCDGHFPDQVLETMREDGICRACGERAAEHLSDEAAEHMRRQHDEFLRRQQVHLPRVRREQRAIEELTARRFAEEREKRGRA